MEDAISKIIGIQKEIRQSAKTKDGIDHFLMSITKEDEQIDSSSEFVRPPLKDGETKADR
jgi:hypothetical protein